MIDFLFKKDFNERNYHELKNMEMYHSNCDDNIKHEWVYSKKHDECAMVSLDYDKLDNKWILSFPIKESFINYRVKLNSREDVNYYIRFILVEDLLQ